MKILLIAPLIDIPTITSNLAVSDIVEYGKTKPNVEIELLFGLKANRLFFNFVNLVRKFDAIFYWGHGKENSLAGNHIFWSMISKTNIHKTDKAPYDVMACHSAAGLGKFAVKNGTSAYIGTITPYYAAFPEKEHNFLRDWIDYTSCRQKALMDGKTFGEAYDLFVEKCNYYLSIYKSRIGYKNYDWYYQATLSNLKNTILIGDPNAKLV